jgi:hypothetical protein
MMKPCPSLRVLVGIAVVLQAASTCSAQLAPGFRLFGPLDGMDTYLVDVNGTIVQTWSSAFTPGVGHYLDPADGTLLRTIRTPGAPTIGGAGGGIQRIGLDNTILWQFQYDGPLHWTHHDIELLPNGNVLLIAWDNKTIADAVAAGRNPALNAGTVFRADSIIELQQTGPTTANVVWEWHLLDHLVQDFDPSKANFGGVLGHPELVNVNYPPLNNITHDWNHANGLDYDPVHDRIAISCLQQNEVYIIDHSTTTAQAAGHTGGTWGHGGDILYRYGNPAAYNAGTAADQKFFGQHSPEFIPQGYPGAGNMLVFNNNAIGGTAVWEFLPPIDAMGNFILVPGSAYGPAAPLWTYSAPGFNSSFISGCERLPNGNTLICAGAQAWVFEVTPSAQVLWNYTIPGPNTLIFHAHYVERTLWADKKSVSAAGGATVTFDLITGTPYAGKTYILLGSGSGTAPGTPIAPGLVLPLNFDPILQFTFDNVNTPLLTNTLGTLDANGRATATLNFPPTVIAGALQGHFAAAILDIPTASVWSVTNAVPLTINP